VSLNSIDFGSNQTALPISIKNVGKSTLDWQVNENVAWLSVNPVNGTTTSETDNIIITVDRSGLSQGSHSQTISITSNGGSETISVTVLVSGPILNVSPVSLDFGSTEVEKTVFASNSGIGTITFNASTTYNWITVTPTTGSLTTQTSSVVVSASRVGMSAGTYTGSVLINSNSNAVTVSVNMTVIAPAVPTVTCGQAGSITYVAAQLPGNISTLGSDAVTQHGHCWGTSPNPTTADLKTSLGSATSAYSFTSNLNGLAPLTTYYVRTYATNSVGTGYSAQVTFTTQAQPTLPVVTIGSSSQLTFNSVSVQANISNLGDGYVTQRGHCWSTSSNPTISNSKTELGSTTSTGNFTSSIAGLSSQTTYYVRAYAINSLGTAYSQEISITTNAAPPVVTSGLLAYYSFDGQNANDYYGNFNGTIQGGVTSSSDISNSSGYSMQFDGTGYISLPSNPLQNVTTFTLSFWLKTSQNGGIFLIPNNFYGYDLEIRNNKIYRGINNPIDLPLDVSGLLLNNSWHHLIIVETNTNGPKSLYIDGSLVITANQNASNMTATEAARIGKGYSSFPNFNGKMDNVRIYNRALTQSEITEIYNARQ
jgi:hypothetical protein